MNESTTITIDNIVKLIEGIAKAEYQRGYVAGLEEKRLTEKYWGRVDESVDKAVDEKSCDTCFHWRNDINHCGFVFKCDNKLFYKSREDKTE